MDGRIFGTNWNIQPDQISVANPVILLISISLFEFVIYPTFGKCGLLTKSIHRMTVGGLLAAVTFLLSALIELNIQRSMPLMIPEQGSASLVVVNGLNGCSMVNPTIAYAHLLKATEQNQPDENVSNISLPTEPPLLTNVSATIITTNATLLHSLGHPEPINMPDIAPLSHQQVSIISANSSFLNNYRLTFKLAGATNVSTNYSTYGGLAHECPLDSGVTYELTIRPLGDQAVNLIYVEQGNGKLNYKLFNESLQLPPSGKARVRLVYEFFGSSLVAAKRSFSLITQPMSGGRQKSGSQNTGVFKGLQQDGQVIVSEHLDLEVPPTGGYYELITSDNLIKTTTTTAATSNGQPKITPTGSQLVYQHHLQQPPLIYLKPGTRNLITVHQIDADQVQVEHQVLQDNDYRISMLYQLAPYTLISISEVMFSITGLEFSYSMAPETMKSVIMAAWFLTIAFGNIITVAVESLHIFSDVTYDFIFYATLMVVDMIIFTILAHNYKPPHKSLENVGSVSSRTD